MDDHQTHCPDNNNTNQNHGASHSHQNKEQDRFLPIANVGRIMKKMIPGNGKISKDAKESAQECVSEFISFVTGEASDKCQREKRKTINGDDVIWSITTLGFEDYVAPLKKYLKKYRQIEEEKLNNVPKQQHRIGADQDHSLGGFTSSSPTQFVIQHHHQGHFEGGAGMEQGYMCTLQQQQDQLEYGGRQWGRDL